MSFVPFSATTSGCKPRETLRINVEASKATMFIPKHLVEALSLSEGDRLMLFYGRGEDHTRFKVRVDPDRRWGSYAVNKSQGSAGLRVNLPRKKLRITTEKTPTTSCEYEIVDGALIVTLPEVLQIR